MKDYIRNQRGRMFDSAFFEFFSKVHPAPPFVLSIPAVVALQGWALYQGVTTWMLGTSEARNTGSKSLP